MMWPLSDEQGLDIGAMKRCASWSTWLCGGIVALLLHLLKNRALQIMPQLQVLSQTELCKLVDGLVAEGLAGRGARTWPSEYSKCSL
jgi:hypothetical protein